MSDELKAAAERLLSGEAYFGDVEDCYLVCRAYPARLAADEQQADRIAALERELDEARSLLRELLACGVSYTGRTYVELQVPGALIQAMRDAAKGGDE